MRKTIIKLFALPQLKISDGSLEALKWLALIAMTIDHANRFFYGASIYSAYCVGRLAMPLFAFILAFNLTRPETLSSGAYIRILQRLALYGLLATPAYIIMRNQHSVFPLNIMFTLFFATAFLYYYEQGGITNLIIAIFLFLLGGLFAEYNWPGIAFCIVSWFYCKKPSLLSLIAGLFIYFLLGILNGNQWALLTIPMLLIATQINLKIPRIKHFFYVYYPFHLSLFFFLKESSIL